MQKLKLNLDEVEVTTFAAEDAPKPVEGTVNAATTVDACIPTIIRPNTCDC